MSDVAFEAFAARLVPTYAYAMTWASEWAAQEALARSRYEFRHRLPQGIRTPGHDLLQIVPELNQKTISQNDFSGSSVGELWLQFRTEAGDSICALLDLYIDPAARQRGYGRAALFAAETRARDAGASAMRLTVLGNNVAAYVLYKSAGYCTLNTRLTKTLNSQATLRRWLHED